jgi:hypothetical protein
LTSGGLQETCVRPWLLGRAGMGFASAANFAAKPGVGRTPAEAVCAATNRQGHGLRGSLVRGAGYCEPSPIHMAHAYDDSVLSPAAGCRGIRTVDATIRGFSTCCP